MIDISKRQYSSGCNISQICFAIRMTWRLCVCGRVSTKLCSLQVITTLHVLHRLVQVRSLLILNCIYKIIDRFKEYLLVVFKKAVMMRMIAHQCPLLSLCARISIASFVVAIVCAFQQHYYSINITNGIPSIFSTPLSANSFSIKPPNFLPHKRYKFRLSYC